VDPVADPLLLRKSESVARDSDHYTTEDTAVTDCHFLSLGETEGITYS
jgi:hypothetical protein